jgi:hypothetical protein
MRAQGKFALRATRVGELGLVDARVDVVVVCGNYHYVWSTYCEHHAAFPSAD